MCLAKGPSTCQPAIVFGSPTPQCGGDPEIPHLHTKRLFLLCLHVRSGCSHLMSKQRLLKCSHKCRPTGASPALNPAVDAAARTALLLPSAVVTLVFPQRDLTKQSNTEPVIIDAWSTFATSESAPRHWR